MLHLRNLGAAIVFALPLAVHAEEVTIAALGDSLTQGYGLPEEQGFVPVLEAWLTGRGHDVRILNAGVSGDTTAGGLSRLDWTLSEDVDGLIVTLGGNDLLRGIEPETSRANLSAILSKARDRELPVLLVGMQAPANYGADYKAAFDAMYPDLATEFGTLYATSFLHPLVDAAGGSEPTARRDYMQADGIHPNAAGVNIIVEAIGPDVEELIEQAQ